jgi:hypothetical protein
MKVEKIMEHMMTEMNAEIRAIQVKMEAVLMEMKKKLRPAKKS